jgi:hypothetical protein
LVGLSLAGQFSPFSLRFAAHCIATSNALNGRCFADSPGNRLGTTTSQPPAVGRRLGNDTTSRSSSYGINGDDPIGLTDRPPPCQTFTRRWNSSHRIAKKHRRDLRSPLPDSSRRTQWRHRTSADVAARPSRVSGLALTCSNNPGMQRTRRVQPSSIETHGEPTGWIRNFACSRTCGKRSRLGGASCSSRWSDHGHRLEIT